jgi:hypothetical protein
MHYSDDLHSSPALGDAFGTVDVDDRNFFVHSFFKCVHHFF